MKEIRDSIIWGVTEQLPLLLPWCWRVAALWWAAPFWLPHTVVRCAAPFWLHRVPLILRPHLLRVWVWPLWGPRGHPAPPLIAKFDGLVRFSQGRWHGQHIREGCRAGPHGVLWATAVGRCWHLHCLVHHLGWGQQYLDEVHGCHLWPHAADLPWWLGVHCTVCLACELPTPGGHVGWLALARTLGGVQPPGADQGPPHWWAKEGELRVAPVDTLPWEAHQGAERGAAADVSQPPG
jgi:hypothetical protein